MDLPKGRQEVLLQHKARTITPFVVPVPKQKPELLDDVIKQHILGAFEYCSGNICQTADIIGMEKQRLKRYLKNYGVVWDKTNFKSHRKHSNALK